ncbi:MAG: 16S rRNA (guanine(527)-N(7))-methyltransferase RsmG [Oscillospiraceae bacterium]|nr:16S rRNA (guanine(527)-N(7))-methyltransferase RsmG [Oscillospiraceae bacterium]
MLDAFCASALRALSPVELNDDMMRSFSALYDRVKEVNGEINITAIDGMCPVVLRHFADSLSLLSVKDFCQSKAPVVCDIGCGGGFPGLPIKIAKPDMWLSMIDSTEKKLKSVETTAQIIGINDISFFPRRAEEIGKASQFREKYDFAVARAVAGLNVLSELCLPFVKQSGYFLAMKGARADEEIAVSQKAIKMLGGEIIEKLRVDIKYEDVMKAAGENATADEADELKKFCDMSRYIIIIKKTARTDQKYPRQYSRISKNPL